MQIAKPWWRQAGAAFSLALFSLSSSLGVTYYVKNGGDNSRNGRSEADAWGSITYAVSSGSPVTNGDEVVILPGSYFEEFLIQKSGITLRGQGNRDSVRIIDPTPNGPFFGAEHVGIREQSNVTLRNFRVENSSWGGVVIKKCQNILVDNVYTFETGSSGIIALPLSFYGGGEAEVADSSRNVRVLNCVVERACWKPIFFGDNNEFRRYDQEALSIWGVDGFEVAYCRVFDGNTEGIDAKTGSRNGSIHHCEVYGMARISGLPGDPTIGSRNSGPGIYVDGNRAASFNIQVYNNFSYNNNENGISISDEDPNGGLSNIAVYNNVTYGNGILGVNGGVGVAVDEGNDIRVYNNTSVGDTIGFFLSKSPTNVVFRNNIVANAVYRTIEVGNFSGSVTFSENLFTNEHPVPATYGSVTGLSVFNNQIVADAGLTELYRLTASSPASIPAPRPSLRRPTSTIRRGRRA
ncbi:MAG: hypothetical protein HC841_07125, partial [Verrucomicrobiae bacterium]|nr:hypothetical protein [Verrucomicrobiae bacterium]